MFLQNQNFMNKLPSRSPKDFTLISYPKSGRTWLRFMIGSMLCQLIPKTKCEPQEYLISGGLQYLPLHQNIEAKILPFIRTAHAVEDAESNPDPTSWHIDESIKNAHIIALIRDPRDVIVSSYFQRGLRDNNCEYSRRAGLNNLTEPECHKFLNQNGSFITECSCFPPWFSIRDQIYWSRGGFESILYYYKLLLNLQPESRSFFVIRYEDLKNNGKNELLHLAQYLNVDITPKIAANAVEAGSFENMRQVELSFAEFSKKLGPRDISNTETYKTRKGEVGGYTNYVDKIDIQWMNARMKAILPPYFQQFYN
eukprot:TRINITY_DN4004_c1_g5_i1.p1 TRINITY_DN4004_c1_g5~~TRINITY_DN4004_c1_g5_i1.p1  ORF type:complete len:311 (+),score=149.21 TRINITY_DN4004_c1_g5_i1:115-1047(+)